MFDSLPSAHDVSNFGSDKAKLVWAIDSNGKMAKISTVANGAKCKCRCPNPHCNEYLIAKTNHQTPHYSHSSNSKCNGGGPETAIHILAKEAIEEHKKLYLIERRASFAGREVILSKARLVEFDMVVAEHRELERIVPDIYVEKAGRNLLIEIAVTHPCDEMKIEKIRARGVPALEIDLSGLPRNADRDVITQAVIYDAPRSWLFHADIDSAHAKLRAAHEKKEADATKQFDDALNLLSRDYRLGLSDLSKQEKLEISDADELRATRLVQHIGIHISGAGCFTWPLDRWQNFIIREFVVGSQLGHDAYRVKTVFSRLKDAGAIRPLFKFVNKEFEAALQAGPLDFLTPYRAIEMYLFHLAREGFVYKISGAYQTVSDIRVSIEGHRERLVRIQRRTEGALETARKILAFVPVNERGKVTAKTWLQQHQSLYGSSFKAAIDADSGPYDEMSLTLRNIERMIFENGPIIESTLELPIAQERERQRNSRKQVADERAARKAEADEKAHLEKEVSENEARVSRISRFKREVNDSLGNDSADWLKSQSEQSESIDLLSLAASSELGLDRAFAMLRTTVHDRNEKAKKQKVIDRFVWQLVDDATRSLGHQRCQLFIRSAYKELGGKKPIDYCVDKVTLAECLDLLKVVARKK
ncbi:hypothetical protein HNQ36_003451 [Afipia massiliensis]|uniref:Uncharacterized protein n=1 Tax=Afipia massiliensis TaxID=211460 RepID=A0A840N2Z1_9BRAD|nr:hypothetical protein [Afipia massiliensis]MBB5053460.1 hypothetical protein [Afipia massiliensis]